MPMRDTWRTSRVCPVCGDSYMPVREHQIYDTAKCRLIAFQVRKEQRIRAAALAEATKR